MQSQSVLRFAASVCCALFAISTIFNAGYCSVLSDPTLTTGTSIGEFEEKYIPQYNRPPRFEPYADMKQYSTDTYSPPFRRPVFYSYGNRSARYAVNSRGQVVQNPVAERIAEKLSHMSVADTGVSNSTPRYNELSSLLLKIRASKDGTTKSEQGSRKRCDGISHSGASIPDRVEKRTI